MCLRNVWVLKAEVIDKSKAKEHIATDDFEQ